MNISQLRKKGQGLPLNTIVIAVLVIIVLLVIIVFFTGQIGESGETLEQNSASTCGPNNPALNTVYGDEAIYEQINDTESCSENYESTPVNNCCVQTN